MFHRVTLVLLLAIVTLAFCAPSRIEVLAAPAEVPEDSVSADKSYFDFLLGEWLVSWEGFNGTETAKSTIQRTLGDHVIEETFKIMTGRSAGLESKSWKVFLTHTNEWRTTWVDNEGGYKDFVAQTEDSVFAFFRDETDWHGDLIDQRIRYFNIDCDTTFESFKVYDQLSTEEQYELTEEEIVNLEVEGNPDWQFVGIKRYPRTSNCRSFDWEFAIRKPGKGDWQAQWLTYYVRAVE